MPLAQLDQENADRNLTSIVTVLTNTPHASEARQCQAYIAFGDGTKNLDGSGGDFEITVTIGGQTVEPNPQVITFSTAVRTAVWTTPFPVPANTEVIIRVLSPNAADSDVDVTATLYDVPVGDTIQVSGDATAANNLEAVLDGDGTGAVLTLSQLRINSAAAGGAVDIDNSGGPGIDIDGTTFGVDIDASAGRGVAIDGTTYGLSVVASNGPGIYALGTTTGARILATNGPGIYALGTTYGFDISASAGSGVRVVGTTNDILADITGDLSGSVGSLTGHTVQTGDSYAIVNGDHGLVSIQDDVDAILADTAQLSGAGAIPWTVTVTVSGNPIDGAEVRITSDAAGNTAVEGPKYTDASGEADFRLDAGTYYAWVSASGYNFTNPTELEVSS